MRLSTPILVNIRTIFIFLYGLWLSSDLFAQISLMPSLSVYIKENNITLYYPKPTRLDKLLIDANQSLSYSPYQLGSALINPSQQASINQKKQNILAALKKINHPVAQRLYEQINSLSFAAKININLDLDAVRIFPKNNPLLRGKYVLYLPQRPNYITILGSTQALPIYLNMQSGNSLTDYLQAIVFSPQSDKDYPWVIQANQQVYQSSNVYWKSDKTFLSPGAIIFIGLRNLPTEFAHLNEQIAELLAYHVEK